MLVGIEQALAPGLLDEGGDLVAGEGAGNLVPRSHPQEPQAEVGGHVQTDDRRPQTPDDTDKRWDEQQSASVRPGQGDVLGNHLADDDMQEHHYDHGCGERDQMPGGVGQPDRCERTVQQVGNRGFPE